jgi:hypothetical protein
METKAGGRRERTLGQRRSLYRDGGSLEGGVSEKTQAVQPGCRKQDVLVQLHLLKRLWQTPSGSGSGKI